MAEHSQALAQLIDRARRRQLTQLIAEQSGLALGTALAGAVVLLLIGTQILDWYWLVILFAASLAIGLWRTIPRVPSRYAVAQQIDAHAGLHDAVSTAYHFEHSERPASAELCRAQREWAETAARRVDLVAAFPFVLPKTLHAAGGIALVACGMFAIRYGVTRSLDLRPSLVKIAFDTFFTPDPRNTADHKSPLRKKIEEELEKLGIKMNATDAKADELDPNANVLTAADSPETLNSGDPDSAKSKASSVPNEKESGESGGEEKSEKSAAANSDKSATDSTPEGNDGNPQNGQQTSDPKNGKESQGQNSSLLDKMRDAMSNLMDKMKMNSKQGDSKQSAQQNSQQGSQSQKASKGEKGEMAGKQQANGSDQQSDQSQQAQGDQSQSAKGKSGDRNADQQASQDAKSGIGKQDGDKSAREAEQLAAMGKISEILGKRAKDMSGEVMVEVSAGKQQLKTQYSSSNAAHAEAGSEINRDEVPLEYQEYVQQYFEQIRKLPAPAKK